jgi:hypothetical protein
LFNLPVTHIVVDLARERDLAATQPVVEGSVP